MIKRVIKAAVLTLVASLIAIQFVPVARSNPPVLSTVAAPEPVMQTLRRSCFDCHSNETVWPWYSKMAPVSWLVSRDVREGREALNFSEWTRYGRGEQSELIAHCVEEVGEGEMPMRIYELMHPQANIDADEMKALRAWALSFGAAPGSGNDDEDDD